MSSDLLISAEAVGKRFCRDLRTSLRYGVQDILFELLPKRRLTGELRHKEFWAVDDVSLEVRRGDALALIGRNGAGKTTLLKLLNGLIKPDRGRIVVRGRVGALIALGAGFNPILTGRENVYVNGAVLGISRQEIDQRFDEIVAFSELEKFIDTPVRNYSSGMQVRLGFAIATALDPDVLLLDEVLAVGDAAFRSKCYRRMAELQSKAAMIFVSHSMENVGRVCDSALVMASGQTVYQGPVEGGIAQYEKMNELESDEGAFLEISPPLESANVRCPSEPIEYAQALSIQLDLEASENVGPCVFRVLFYNPSGAIVGEWSSRQNDFEMILRAGSQSWTIDIPVMLLRSGSYRLGMNLLAGGGKSLLLWSHKQHSVKMNGLSIGMADYQMQGTLIAEKTK